MSVITKASEMHLLNLPAELLLSIVTFAFHDLEAVTLSCKSLQHVAKQHLPEYNALRGRFRSFTYDRPLVSRRGRWAGKTDIIRSPLDLLIRIAANPVIAKFIETADLTHAGLGDDEREGIATSKRLRETPKEKDMLVEFLEGCQYLQDAEIDAQELLDHAIEQYDAEGDMTELEALLLTLLPNVRMLAAPHSWDRIYGKDGSGEDEASIWRLFDLIVKRANDKSTREGAALAKVHTLLPITYPSYDHRIRLLPFTPLLSLPMVRDFYGGSVLAFCDGYTGTELLDTRYASFGRALETIWLKGSCVDHKNIGVIAAHCPRLKSLRMSYEVKWHGCGYNFDVGHFIKEVEHETYDRLEDLAVSVGSGCNSTGTGVVSMKRFQKLKTVELDMPCMEGPPVGEVDDIDWNEDDEGDLPDGDNETPPLTQIFPDSIESISLLSDVQSQSLEILRKLFTDLPKDWKETLLPKLQDTSVKVSAGDRTGSSFREAMDLVEKAGVCVEVCGNVVEADLTSELADKYWSDQVWTVPRTR